MSMSREIRHDIVAPDAPAFSETMRAFGYDLSTAVADIVDNSISALATKIDITFFWAGRDTWVRIEDNGCGMDAETLVKAMKLGSSNPLEKRRETDLGRFGLGLKTASFSQCRRLTVMAKIKNCSQSTRCWDLDYIAETRNWSLIRGVWDKKAEDRLGKIPEGSSGTVVLWEKPDHMVGDHDENDTQVQKHFFDKIEKVEKHLSMVYHRFMVGKKPVKIFINGNLLESWDPFLECEGATQKLQEENFGTKERAIQVIPFVLPHKSRIDSQTHDLAAGIKGWNAHQGFYIYRNRRLLVSGDWLGFFKQEEHYKLARIMLDIPNSVDKEWKIDVRKAVARPPDYLKKDLKRISEATRARAVAVYRHKGAIVLKKNSRNNVFVWVQVKKHGESFYRLNREHPLYKNIIVSSPSSEDVRSYLRLIEETFPVPMVVADFSESENSQSVPFKNKEDELLKLAKLYFSCLKKEGKTDDEVLEILPHVEPFMYHPEFIEVIKEKCIGETVQI